MGNKGHFFIWDMDVNAAKLHWTQIEIDSRKLTEDQSLVVMGCVLVYFSQTAVLHDSQSIYM